jgi:hypothetical protein
MGEPGAVGTSAVPAEEQLVYKGEVFINFRTSRDIAAFTAALATRVGTRATHVTEADARYVANEAHSANELAAVAEPVTVA